MAFVPFAAADFQLLARKQGGPGTALHAKADALSEELSNYPEFDLDFFRKRIVRRGMTGQGGRVFTGPKWGGPTHWYFYPSGGDQDEIQLNVGMFETHIRVGIGFQIGRQVRTKVPAFRTLQTLLATRPPLPFRERFLRCVESNG
ncbi:MAG: hypothetical protein AB1609_19550, partial [Bacillota bacterium]